jgi:hypothetical protein
MSTRDRRRYDPRNNPNSSLGSQRQRPSANDFQRHTTRKQKAPKPNLDEDISALVSRIDYRSIGVRPSTSLNKEHALADGLAYILFLQDPSSFPRGHRPRPIGMREVTQQLARVLPTSSSLDAGVTPDSRQRNRQSRIIPDKNLLIATRTHIDHLLQQRYGATSRPARLFGDLSPPLTRPPTPIVADSPKSPVENQERNLTQSQVQTQTALRKIDQWLDLWLAGERQNLVPLQDCLSLPD